MAINQQIPTFRGLFGALGLAEADPSRSVYSPAAYLADLLQLMGDRFGDADLFARRPDLPELPLDGTNTFSPIPVLDIVNQVLERRIAALTDRAPYAVLADADAPMSLPFDLDHVRVRAYLAALGVRPDAMPELFAPTPDRDGIAREQLGLSRSQLARAVTDLSDDPAALAAAFGVDPADGLAPLTDVARFKDATDLDANRLRELLYGNLAEGVKSTAGVEERALAASFFIHHELGGRVRLDPSRTKLTWTGAGEIPNEWFDRVNRLIRLAGWIGFDLSELDRVLRTCCGHQLDDDAICQIATIRAIRDASDWDVDTVCGLFGEMDVLGSGHEPPPALFDRVFNGRQAEIDGTYVPAGTGFVPKGSEAHAPMRFSADLLSEEAKGERDRVSRCLGLSDGQLRALVEGLRERAAARGAVSSLDGRLNIDGISLLHRMTRLLERLDLAPTDLLGLLDLLEHDPSVRAPRFLGVTDAAPANTSVFEMLDRGDPADRFWLVQVLFAVERWMSTNGLEVSDLHRIVVGPSDEEVVDAVRAFVESVSSQFGSAALRPERLETDDVGPRLARIAFDSIVEPARRLSVETDPRIVTFDADRANVAAEAALDRLETVTADDLLGLGLGDRFAAHIFEILVRARHLDLTGVMQSDRLPEPSALLSATDFSAIRAPLFEILRGLYADAVAADPEAIELSLYPSDLDPLRLPTDEAAELYATLQLQGVVDADGRITDVSLLADPNNAARLPLDTGLAPHAPAVLGVLAAAVAQYHAEPLRVDADLWADLPLDGDEREALVANLIFNGYLDEHQRVLDKPAVLDLDVAGFDLALPFYPHRHEILSRLQRQTTELRRRYLTFSVDAFSGIGDVVAAGLAHRALVGAHLRNDQLTDSARRAFEDAAPVQLGLGSGFHATDEAAVAKRLRSIAEETRSLRLRPAALASIGFDEQEAAAVLGALAETGALGADGQLGADRRATYLNVNSALTFSVPDFEDYQKEIFFLIRAVAKRRTTLVDALTGRLRAADSDQRALVDKSMAAWLESSRAVAAELMAAFHRFASHPHAEILTPALAAAAAPGGSEHAPRDRRFEVTLRRIQQLAAMAGQLGADARELHVALADQHLVDKLPEALVLPAGVSVIDTLVDLDGQIHLFSGDRYWTFDTATLAPLEAALPLDRLAPLLAGAKRVDAAYVDADGNAWLLAGVRYLKRSAGDTRWAAVKRLWGQRPSAFDDPARIDAAFTDSEGRTYLFAGDEYVRYTEVGLLVDEGYPRTIAEHWKHELSTGSVPAGFESDLDAAFTDRDGITHLFKGHSYVSTDDPSTELSIAKRWGRVRNNFEGLDHLDGVAQIGDVLCLFLGDQVMIYADGLEDAQARAVEGYPRTIAGWQPNLPHAFQEGVRAGVTTWDGANWLFGDEVCVRRAPRGRAWKQTPTTVHWGIVRNSIQAETPVDAALAGLDGRVYLFSGDQCYRYSGTDLRYVDAGYPRRIDSDWGPMRRVDAAFVLEGRTYLFGHGAPTEADDGAVSEPIYVRFSTSDYSQPDEGFPTATNDNWWNVPFELIGLGFDNPDAVFIAPDGSTYLFSGDRFVTFDHDKRWWSAPARLADRWDSLPFDRVTAAFTGKDGRVYVFSDSNGDDGGGPSFVRYTDPTLQRVDDRYPKPVRSAWGKVQNNIQRTGRVDAAVTVVSTTEAEGGEIIEAQHTYLFSGRQYFRYTGTNYREVDEGYPRLIHASLRDEPRFQNLPAGLGVGLDGIAADSHNVYLFDPGDLHVVSTAHYRDCGVLEAAPDVGAIDLEEGTLYVERAAGWSRLNAPEATHVRARDGGPRLLRQIPERLRAGTKAVLRGLDDNVYVFGQQHYFDRSLDRVIAINEGWGRVKNTIERTGRVDAGFVGTDGALYLFSADQFFKYTPHADTPHVIPPRIDGHPLSIEAHWGGLQNVRVAYVRDGVTYLMEAPDERGVFRYVRYSGDDYTRPDNDAPLRADFSFWQLPSLYVEQGFDSVDAVLVEKDNLFLIRDRRFVQLDQARDMWIYPRPIERLWPDLPDIHPDFESMRTALKGPGDQTYFFSDTHWCMFKAGAVSIPSTISARWGLLTNQITDESRVDAAVVAGGATYLFAGKQYVRYSTDNKYEHVDEGYPKTVAENLRQEAGFEHLPDTFEDTFAEMTPADRWIVGAFSNLGVLYLLTPDGPNRTVRLHAVSGALHRRHELGLLGRIRDEIGRLGTIDAAFVEGQVAYLLSGDQYVRYSDTGTAWVDDGYPRAIGSDLLADLQGERGPGQPVPVLEGSLTYALDAVFRGRDGAFYLFKGRDYRRFQPGDPAILDAIAPIQGRWGKAADPFEAAADENTRIDAAFVAPDGALYVFKGPIYARYETSTADTVDEGYPRAIRDHWGDLPAELEGGVRGGFQFEGRTYLTRGARHVRYTDPTLQRIDPNYPQTFASRWRRTNDISLRDLTLIERFLDLAQTRGDDEQSLTDLLHGERAVTAPYALLAAMFDWRVEDVVWLKRHDGFLDRPARAVYGETDFDLELLLRLHDVLTTVKRTGASPSELYDTVWLPLYAQDAPLAPTTAADALYRLLGRRVGGAEWDVLDRQLHDQLHDQLNGAQRDALVAYVIAHDSSVAHARDLSEQLLLDVETAPCAQTSRIKEAAAAAQLYFHRYLVNLERLQTLEPGDREDLKARWPWMKSYRVWEANRRVFLYPENYLRPELRDTKTPAFESLEDDLLQGEITADSVERAFKKYLDEYTEVSRQSIAGGYVYDEGQEGSHKALILFGHTRTEPKRYYYRTATFKQGERQGRWRPWLPVGLEINATRVYPVRAFGRMFLFWADVETQNASDASAKIETREVEGDGDVQEVSGETPLEHHVRIYFSYYNLNKEWIQPQALDIDVVEPRPIRGLRLFVEHSAQLHDVREEHITVGCDYNVGAWNRRENVFYSLTADLETREAVRPEVGSAGFDLFQQLFERAEAAQVSVRDEVVELSTHEDSTDGPWFSFDHKGGSFLCKPAEPSLTPPLTPIVGRWSALADWPRVRAALRGPDGSVFLFHPNGQDYAEILSNGAVTMGPIRGRWGRRETAILRTQRVDAAWTRGKILYLSNGTELLTYSDGVDLADDDPPKTLGDAGTPAWQGLDAACQSAGGRMFFFHGTDFAEGADGTKTQINRVFGRQRNALSDPKPGTRPVLAAFVRDQRTFLIGEAVYAVYTGADYVLCNADYPRPQTLHALLEDLGCDNNEDAFDDLKLISAWLDGSTVVLTTKEAVYRLTGRQVVEDKDTAPVSVAMLSHQGRTFLFDDDPSVRLDDESSALPRRIDAAMVGLDGALYLFGGTEFVQIGADDLDLQVVTAHVSAWTGARPIGKKWGTEANGLTTRGRVDAAFCDGDHTYLISGDSYVRYTGEAFEFVDNGYPRALAGNPTEDALPAWSKVDAAVRLPSGERCFFRDGIYALSTDLTTEHAIDPRWGVVRNKIVADGVDAAYTTPDAYVLVSGDERVMHGPGPSTFIDKDQPKRFRLNRFGRVRAAFTTGGRMYLVGDHSFVCCDVDNPERILPGYPRKGRMGAVVIDVLERAGIEATFHGWLDRYGINGAFVHQGTLRMGLGRQRVGHHGIAVKIDLSTGHVTVNFGQMSMRGAYTHQGVIHYPQNDAYDAATVVGDALYVFRGGDFMVAAVRPLATLSWSPDPRGSEDVWGMTGVDAAFHRDGRTVLFARDLYLRFDQTDLPTTLGVARPRRGLWGNVPAAFSSGIDAVLDADEGLYLFRGPQLAFFPADGPQPYEIESARYDIIRLTTGTAAELNAQLFKGGVGRLLSMRTQQVDETPRFSFVESSATTIQLRRERIGQEPVGSHLDFDSANGIYYWEIFFHAPFLIAQALNTGQKFAEAKTWYEHIFDPTEAFDHWKLLPFLAVDVGNLREVVGDRLTQLNTMGVDLGDIETPLTDLTDLLLPMDDAFQGHRHLDADEIKALDAMSSLDDLETAIAGLLPGPSTPADAFRLARTDLVELVGIIERLRRNYDAGLTTDPQVTAYLDDPFDPHAIANLRRLAYRKAIVMRYVDNLLDWADMLFGRYTMETIEEARMLYILAYDLLGRRPERTGAKVLSTDRPFAELHDADTGYELLMYISDDVVGGTRGHTFSGAQRAELADKAYFHIPHNALLHDYWDRVEDRLYKIRHCLNIHGIKQPLPLFEPPIDPMALVRAASGGGGLTGAVGLGGGVAVPHYRFSFMVNKARALAQSVSQLGSELLATLEKRDAEELSALQARQEGEVLDLTMAIREAQHAEAQAGLASLQAALGQAQLRHDTYDGWVSGGFSAWEIAQMGVMGGAVIAHAVSAISRAVAAVGSAAPDALVGLFITGLKYGGGNANDIFNSVAEVSQSIAEGLSIGAEILGIVGQHERMKEEWKLQRDMATSDLAQLTAQVEGARHQIDAARHEITVLNKQIDHNRSVAKYYRAKFTNRELYQWMAGRLSTLYFQGYQLALGMARAAEKAFQFEQGRAEADVAFIGGAYWDGQRKGLVAADALGLDLDRMEAAYIETDARRFEITKNVSLLDVDPLAFLRLKATGRCDFDLTEAFFDDDFPGHYCRQVKTIALSFDIGEGIFVNATLTQLTHRTVIAPDPKAVKFLLAPSGEAPLSIRSNWKPLQQIALSHHDDYEKNNGLFELRFDSERYLPFEGTGAVSSWRLEMQGKRGSYDLRNLVDVTINLKYTALPGGDRFADAVRGMLRPQPALRYFDMHYDFPKAWNAFLDSDEDTLVLPLTRDLFPNMASGKIPGVFTRYEIRDQGGVKMSLLLDDAMELVDGKIVDTTGLTIRAKGTSLRLQASGDKRALKNINLVLAYTATAG